MVYRSYEEPKKGVTTYVPSQRPGGQFREFEGRRKVTKSSTGEYVIEGERPPANQRKMTVEKAVTETAIKATPGKDTGEQAKELSPVVKELVREQSIAEKALTTKLPAISPELSSGLISPQGYAEREGVPFYTQTQRGLSIKRPGFVVEQNTFLGFNSQQAEAALRLRREKGTKEVPRILEAEEVTLPSFLADRRATLRKEALGFLSVQRTFKTGEGYPGEETEFLAASRMQPFERIIADDRVYGREFRSIPGEVLDDYGLRKAFQEPEDIYLEQQRLSGLKSTKDVVLPKRVYQEISESQFNVGFVAGAGLGAFEASIRTGAIKRPLYPIRYGDPKKLSVEINVETGRFAVRKGDPFAGKVIYERIDPSPEFKKLLQQRLNQPPKRLTAEDVLRAEGLYQESIKTRTNIQKLLENKRAEMRTRQRVVIEEQKPKYDFDVYGGGEYFEVRSRPAQLKAFQGTELNVLSGVGVGSVLRSDVDVVQSSKVRSDLQLRSELKVDLSADFDVVTDVGLRTEQRTDLDRLYDLVDPVVQQNQNVFDAPNSFDRFEPPKQIGLPGLPGFDFGQNMETYQKSMLKASKAFEYQPQFGAVFFGIRGSKKIKERNFFSGLEFRGL